MHGMNPDACASYSIADRFTCRVCQVAPRIVRAEGNGPVQIVFSCHGEETFGVYTKDQLQMNQRVFGTPEPWEGGSGEKFNLNPNRPGK